METETADIGVRPPDFFPVVTHVDLAADGAGGIFHHGEPVMFSDFQKCLEVGGHAHLMDDENRRQPADGRRAAGERLSPFAILSTCLYQRWPFLS